MQWPDWLLLVKPMGCIHTNSAQNFCILEADQTFWRDLTPFSSFWLYNRRNLPNQNESAVRTSRIRDLFFTLYITFTSCLKLFKDAEIGPVQTIPFTPNGSTLAQISIYRSIFSGKGSYLSLSWRQDNTYPAFHAEQDMAAGDHDSHIQLIPGGHASLQEP